MTNYSRSLARQILPLKVRRQIVRYTRWPPVGHADLGHLRRLKPISPYWGSERGQPIDRYYIERFLAANAAVIQEHVLEIGDNTYTAHFGGDRVMVSDVLHVQPGSPKATIIADLTSADQVASNRFDCILCTQTLQLIYQVETAIETLHRILKPGGVLLATVPGISQISRYDMDRWGDHWRFTSASARRLFCEVFPEQDVQVEASGNVLAATAFLHGLAAEELTQDELNYQDPDYELLIAVRAMKPKIMV